MSFLGLQSPQTEVGLGALEGVIGALSSGSTGTPGLHPAPPASSTAPPHSALLEAPALPAHPWLSFLPVRTVAMTLGPLGNPR